MKKLVSTLKAMRLSQVVTVFLVGVLVLFSTACSRTDTIADRLPGNSGSDTPGQSQPYKGGMNNFNDNASNRVNTEAAAKAKALRDKVQSRVNSKGVNSPDDLADNVRSANPGKQAQRFGADVRQQAEDVKDNLQTFGDRGVKNVKRNTDNALDNAADATKDNVNATKRAIDKAA
ncbi:MAG: hypothetical protein KME27_14925 [Lyngbya sp. HA4199-MV5]|nr:hypothetical protein [Lyngbya sp. HA4199-MV5]